MFCFNYVVKVRPCFRVLRSEHRTAILIRLNRDIESIDFAGNCNNFLLIHTDTRPENRHRSGAIGTCKSIHSLACNLTDAFTGDKGGAILHYSNLLRKFHHKAAHNDCEILLRAIIPDSLLKLGKRDNISCNHAGIASNLFKQIHNFHFGKLRSVRRRGEVNGAKLDTPFSHHISRNGRINTAADKHSRPAVSARRHTACAFNIISSYKGIFFPNLNSHDDIGIMNIYL